MREDIQMLHRMRARAYILFIILSFFQRLIYKIFLYISNFLILYNLSREKF